MNSIKLDQNTRQLIDGQTAAFRICCLKDHKGKIIIAKNPYKVDIADNLDKIVNYLHLDTTPNGVYFIYFLNRLQDEGTAIKIQKGDFAELINEPQPQQEQAQNRVIEHNYSLQDNNALKHHMERLDWQYQKKELEFDIKVKEQKIKELEEKIKSLESEISLQDPAPTFFDTALEKAELLFPFLEKYLSIREQEVFIQKNQTPPPPRQPIPNAHIQNQKTIEDLQIDRLIDEIRSDYKSFTEEHQKEIVNFCMIENKYKTTPEKIHIIKNNFPLFFELIESKAKDL
jgi:hypothetical protein